MTASGTRVTSAGGLRTAHQVRRDGPHAYDDLVPELRAHAGASTSDAGYAARRDRLVEAFLPLVRNLARRYSGDGDADDVEQAGVIGLIRAIDRYDPDLAPRGPLSYLVPSVQGEMKRHLRDRTWSIKVPRGLKEFAVTVNQTANELSGELGRSPRVSEIAERLDAGHDDVVDALGALDSYSTRSLDVPDPDTGITLGERIGADDGTFDVVETRDDLREAIAELPERERTILLMRFYGNRTQSEIGRHVGISQMHVSRLLSRSMERLRDRVGLLRDDDG